MNDAVANIPVPADGKSITPDDVRPMLEQMVKLWVRGGPCPHRRFQDMMQTAVIRILTTGHFQGFRADTFSRGQGLLRVRGGPCPHRRFQDMMQTAVIRILTTGHFQGFRADTFSRGQ